MLSKQEGNEITLLYATAPGSVAADGDGRNGIYTSHLLANIKKPELSLQEMLMETGLNVMRATGDKQIPWISSTPIPRYYLVGRAASFETEIQDKKKRITELEKMDKAAARELRRQQDEITAKQAQLEKLDSKLAKLQAKLGVEDTKSDLDAMLAMLEEKERKAKELEELRKKAEQELLAKEAAIAEARRRQKEQRRLRFESDYKKYRKIEASKYASDELKAQAWRLLCKTWGVEDNTPRDRALIYNNVEDGVEVKKYLIKARDNTFIAFDNGVIYDKKTGLDWYVGPDKATSWPEAKRWVANLSVDGGGWRMPAISELKTLYQEGTGVRNMTPLMKTIGWWAWSDGISSGGNDSLYFSFRYGQEHWAKMNNAFGECRAFAVRSQKRNIPTTEPTPQSPKIASSNPIVVVQEIVTKGRNYVKLKSGVVRDTRTGLEWYAGPDKNTTWDEAKRWVSSLNIDRGGWRMPTLSELRGLYQKGAGKRNMTPLLKTTGWWVWSGEKQGYSSGLSFTFYYGTQDWFSANNASMSRAFAVRSQQVMISKSQTEKSTVSSSAKDNITANDGTFVAYVNGVVYDKKTGLEWYAGPDKNTNWNEAKRWVANLTIDDGGWRMPTGNELKSLYQKGVGTHNMTPLLTTTGWWVWSGDRHMEMGSGPYAWGVKMSDGGNFGSPLNSSKGIRAFAVRSR